MLIRIGLAVWAIALVVALVGGWMGIEARSTCQGEHSADVCELSIR